MTPHNQSIYNFVNGPRVIHITVKEAWKLIGLKKVQQAAKIARFAKFYLAGRPWKINKSRNLWYHPVTYTLEVEL